MVYVCTDFCGNINIFDCFLLLLDEHMLRDEVIVKGFV